MSFLARICRLNACLRYISTVNNCPANVSREFCNLQRPYYLTYKFYSLKVKPSKTPLTFDEKVKTYLDYLMNANEQKKFTDSKVKDFLDIIQIRKLLSERSELINAVEECENKTKGDSSEDEILFEKLRLQEVDEELLDIIKKKLHGHNFVNVIMEISAGVGGQEAMLFVRDLRNLYIAYFKYLGATYEILEESNSSINLGGYRSISILVTGKDIFQKLQYEGGVHRVQRVPETEKHGRLHTSVASVAILPEPTDIDVSIKSSDLDIQCKKASGAGGQHVNTTNSAVRIIHIPTGISTECQTGRSQIQNKNFALIKLKNLLYEKELSKQNTVIGNLRRKQLGMRDRNEKIRTYNYHQNRVTDHRISKGTINNLKGFMEDGEALDKLQERLHEDMLKKTLLEVIEKTIGN